MDREVERDTQEELPTVQYWDVSFIASIRHETMRARCIGLQLLLINTLKDQRQVPRLTTCF